MHHLLFRLLLTAHDINPFRDSNCPHHRYLYHVLGHPSLFVLHRDHPDENTNRGEILFAVASTKLARVYYVPYFRILLSQKNTRT